jgi:hypothetical protein
VLSVSSVVNALLVACMFPPEACGNDGSYSLK